MGAIDDPNTAVAVAVEQKVLDVMEAAGFDETEDPDQRGAILIGVLAAAAAVMWQMRRDRRPRHQETAFRKIWKTMGEQQLRELLADDAAEPAPTPKPN